MNFTDQQLKAINSANGNIAVSAGAGSGKTKVLTERIIKNINERKVHLDEILVLTFTKAASNEMKKRIKQRLSENPNTKDLVLHVDSSDISTIDSYQLNLVKKHFDILNISPDVTIVSDEVIEVKTWEYIEEIFDNLIDTNTLFKELIKTYCIKSNDDLAWFVKKISDMMTKFGNEHIQKLLKLDHNKVCNELMNKLICMINSSLESAKINSVDDIVKESATNKNLIANIKRLDNLKQYYKTFDKYFFENYSLIEKNEAELNQKFIPLIIDISRQLNKKISDFKKDKNAYTYTDISNLATKLLKENGEVRDEIKNKLKMIVVDEYQDTSKQQEEFISLISNNNVFVVGDVKQSIYGFRDAHPEQFINKCKLYDSNSQLGLHISMNDNFRSRKEIIDSINRIFIELMHDNSYEEIKYPFFSIYENDPIVKSDKQQYGIYKIENKSDDKTTIINSIIIDIKNKIANKVQIIDKKTFKPKPCEYKDFAILARSKSNFKEIEKAFIKNNIPINAVYDDEITIDHSIRALISLLKLVNEIDKQNDQNIQQIKHWFFSVARSYIFQYTDKQLFDMRENSWLQDSAFLKIKAFALNNKKTNLKEIFFNIINEFKLLEKIVILSKHENALEKLAKNNIFYKKILEMDQIGYSLKDFILFLEKINQMNIEIKNENQNVIDNAVVLTTIHKSKGLEYSIVYLYLSSRQEHHSDLTTIKFLADEKYGFSLPSLYLKENNRSIIELLKKVTTTKEQERNENVRLLYVALTRAKETLIIVYGKKENKKTTKKDNKKIKTLLLDLLKESGELANIKDISITDVQPPLTNRSESFDTNKQLQIKKFNYEFKPNIIYQKASNNLTNDVDLKALKLGSELHTLMECIDFRHIDTSFIKDKNQKLIIDKLLTNEIFKNIKNGNIYQEYSFNNKEDATIGVIDIFVEYSDHIDIVDYKLENTDKDKYENQLKIYKQYLTKIFPNKTINCYLLSLIKNEIKKIDC